VKIAKLSFKQSEFLKTNTYFLGGIHLHQINKSLLEIGITGFVSTSSPKTAGLFFFRN